MGVDHHQCIKCVYEINSWFQKCKIIEFQITLVYGRQMLCYVK
jgi:hypothetical protein